MIYSLNRIVSCFILFCLFIVPALQADDFNTIDNPLDTMKKAIDRHNYLKDIQPYKNVGYFGGIRINLRTDKETGLDESDLTDYAELRFVNNFAGYKIDKELAGKPASECNDEERKQSIGFISYDIWTVGVDYPIAYHIKISCSVISLGYNDEYNDEAYPNAYESAVLGSCAKNEIGDQVKYCIDKLLETFAIKFLKAKGDI